MKEWGIPYTFGDVSLISFVNMFVNYVATHNLHSLRYMMAILGEDEVYMLDRDNCVFKVAGLRFPDRKNLNKHIKNTLLDGVS